MNFPPDYHMHTPLCRHATGRPVEYAREAARQRIPEICFTDHFPAPDGYDSESRMTLEQFPDYDAMIAEAARVPGVVVRFGIEADYYPGSSSFLERWLARQEFDLVLGSVHCLGRWGIDDENLIEMWDTADTEETWKEYFRLIGALADTGLYDVIGHLDLAKKFGFRPGADTVLEMAKPTLDKIAAAGMAIEVNTAGLRKPIGEIYPSASLLMLACERGIPITFGSDAHAPREVGHAFEQAVRWARAAGYTHSARYRRRCRQSVPLPLASD